MKSWMMVRMGGVRHDPQRFMGKIVTMLHFNRDAVEFASHERNVGRFANESFRQRSFRKRLRSVRKYLWSVRKRVEVSSQTLSTFICVEASSVLISDVNI